MKDINKKEITDFALNSLDECHQEKNTIVNKILNAIREEDFIKLEILATKYKDSLRKIAIAVAIYDKVKIKK